MTVCGVVEEVDARLMGVMQRAVGRENRLQASQVARILGVRLGSAIRALDAAVGQGSLKGCFAEGYWVPYGWERREVLNAGGPPRRGRVTSGHVVHFRRSCDGEPSELMQAVIGIVQRFPGRESAIPPGILANAVGIKVTHLCGAISRHRLSGRLPAGFRHQSMVGYWWDDAP